MSHPKTQLVLNVALQRRLFSCTELEECSFKKIHLFFRTEDWRAKSSLRTTTVQYKAEQNSDVMEAILT